MIGYVSIQSQNKNIEFNSDRTYFVDNSITKNLVNSLKKLNETIQTKGSDLKMN